MRQTLWLAAAATTLTLGGCDGLRDAFSAQPDLVASSAGERLTTDRMLELMNAVPSGTVSREGAEYVANLWVDLHLFANARARGALADDSAAIRRVMWQQLTQATLQTWHDSLMAERPEATMATADSVFEAGAARLFQHIIVMPAGVTAADTAAARSRAEGMLRQIKAGAEFARFTPQNNDATKDDQGFLGVGPPGQFVPEFETVAWQLEPGEISDVVLTQFGFHIIRRTPKDEAMPRFLDFARTALQAQADSAYVAQLVAEHEVKVTNNAVQAAKDALEDMAAARRSRTRLVTFRDGAFTVGDLARWLEMFPPQAPAQLRASPDTVIHNFIRNLGENTLVLRQAEGAGVEVPEAHWQGAQLGYRAMVDQLAAALGLEDSTMTAAGLPEAARVDSAAARVEQYVDRLVAGQAQFAPVPPAFTGYLRERRGASFRVNPAGLNRVMELYTAQLVADSAAGVGQAAPTGPIQPAPGPAPVPGDTQP